MKVEQNKVSAAIARAQLELEEALCELNAIPAADPNTVAFASHALNNYLTVTGGTVELMLAHLADHPDEQVRIWLEGLQHVTDLMTRTVSQLMKASVSADLTLRFENVELPILIRRVCHYYQRVADQKAIRVIAEIPHMLQPVRIDRVAFAAVLDNLLSNAVKYSESGKRIWVRLRDERGWVVCEVLDEGPGLSQKDQAKLFQKGVTLTPKPTAGEPTMGYGLAVAKELVDKLGGQIWCESTLGQGASFSVRLPAYEGQTGT